MYTSRRVNIRQGYGTSSNIIQTLAVGTEVTRTGISKGTADGYSWSRVNYNGVTGYLITGALTYEKPAQEEPESEPPVEEQPPEENNQDELNQENQTELEALKNELGTIPEVGINIMPFMFFGSIISCLFMIIEIKRKK